MSSRVYINLPSCFPSPSLFSSTPNKLLRHSLQPSSNLACLPAIKNCSQRNAKDIIRHSGSTSRHSRIQLPSSAHITLKSTSCPKPLNARRSTSTSPNIVCGINERSQIQVSLPCIPDMKYNSAPYYWSPPFGESPCRERCTQPRVCDLDMANTLVQRISATPAWRIKSTLYAKKPSSSSRCPRVRSLSTSEGGVIGSPI